MQSYEREIEIYSAHLQNPKSDVMVVLICC